MALIGKDEWRKKIESSERERKKKRKKKGKGEREDGKEENYLCLFRSKKEIQWE